MLIDAIFPVQGHLLNADHNYYLFSALCYAVPEFHQLESFCFNTINGIPGHIGTIYLADQSILRLRLDSSDYKLAHQLSNTELVVNRHILQLGDIEYRSLQPKETLTARIVTIHTEQDFEAALKWQVENLQLISGEYELLAPQSIRITKGRPYNITGWRTRLKNLTPEDSIKVQELGIGGKRRLGCGVFV